MKAKEIILECYNETAKLVLLSETELRQYLCERFEDDRVLTYSKIELYAVITGVIEGRLSVIEHLIDMLTKGNDKG